MSYRVNPKTLLFENLSDVEKRQLTSEVEDIVLRGSNHYASGFFMAWCKAAGYDNSSPLLIIMTTAYPQRALLSLLRHDDLRDS